MNKYLLSNFKIQKEKKNFHIIKIIFLLFITIFSIACHQQKKSSIGLLLHNNLRESYAKDREFFTKNANSLGLDLKIAVANNDPKLQEEQAKSMINDGIGVLVIIAVNRNLAASIVRYAHEKNVKVIAYERLISNCELDYYIGFDHYEVGKMQASYLINKKPNGNYVLLCGDKTDKNAELIYNGQMSILKPYIDNKQINIVYKGFIEDWSSDEAFLTMCNILKCSGDHIDVVLAANDKISNGCISAIDIYQPDYPCLTTGLDADKFALERIKLGKQTMTVSKSFKREAEEAVNLALKIIKNTTIDNIQCYIFNGSINVPSLLLKTETVDINNLENHLN
jgi:ABC-type xylose transport system substrate-binding protein